jgi:hypothetical protein
VNDGVAEVLKRKLDVAVIQYFSPIRRGRLSRMGKTA